MSDYFHLLEAELKRAAAPKRRRLRPARRVLLVAAALALLAGVPAAAALSGAFDRERRPDGPNRLFHEPPIADGRTANGARWQLLAYEDGGEFCFGIALPTGDPRELAPGGSAGCGVHPPGKLILRTASTSGSRYTKPSPRHSLAFGTAPDAAVRVEITLGGRKVVAPTFDDPSGIEGRFYAVGIPFRWQRPRKHVRALDAQGNVIARAGG